MVVFMIRHGKTQGNLEHRYIGTTDEDLCEEGIEELKNIPINLDTKVFVSPMKRCIQTARIVFPDAEQIICDEFRECDFGDFENKNYDELQFNKNYIQWIESRGTLEFPHGETQKLFRQRCCRQFENIVSEYNSLQRICMVVHGGTIMTLLHHYVKSSKSLYDWQVRNGEGYMINFNINKNEISSISKVKIKI